MSNGLATIPVEKLPVPLDPFARSWEGGRVVEVVRPVNNIGTEAVVAAARAAAESAVADYVPQAQIAFDGQSATLGDWIQNLNSRARQIPLSKFGAVSPGANVQAALDAAITALQDTDDALVLPEYPVIAGRIDRVITGSLKIESQKGSKLLFRPDDGLCLRCPISDPYPVTAMETFDWDSVSQVTRLKLLSTTGLSRGDVCWLSSRDPFNAGSASGGNYPQEAFSIAFVDHVNKLVYSGSKLFDQARYITQVELRKMNKDINIDIDVAIDAVNNDGTKGNIHDATISRANTLGLTIMGFAFPRVRANIISAWRGGLQTFGCWMGEFDVRVHDLPNIPSANGYGYGATDGGPGHKNVWRVQAQRCRSAWTTVSMTGTADFDGRVHQWGIPAFGRVSVDALDTFSTGASTHAEGYGFVLDITVRSSRKDPNEAGVATATAFQDRARRTTVLSLVAHDCRTALNINKSASQDIIPDPGGMSVYNNIHHYGENSGYAYEHSIQIAANDIGDKIIIGDVYACKTGRVVYMAPGAKAEIGKITAHGVVERLAALEAGAELRLSDFSLDARASSDSKVQTPFAIGNGASLVIQRGSIQGAADLTSLFGVAGGATGTVAYAIHTDAIVAEKTGSGALTVLPLFASGLSRSTQRREFVLASSGRSWSPHSGVAMLLENSTDVTLTLVASATGKSIIAASDTDQAGVGLAYYDHATNEWVHTTATTEKLRVGPSGVTAINGRINVGNQATGPRIVGGTGSPEGIVSAPKGSLYLRSDGGPATSQYTKESGTGNTGWVAK